MRPGRLFRNPFSETMNAVIRVLDGVAGSRCDAHGIGGNAVMCVKFYLTTWRPYLERHKPVAVPFVRNFEGTRANYDRVGTTPENCHRDCGRKSVFNY